MADLTGYLGSEGVLVGVMLGVPFLAVFLFAFPFAVLARLLGMVDVPDGARKLHEAPAVLAGGMAVGVGVCVTYMLLPYGRGEMAPLVAGGLVILFLNMLDDARGLPAGLRFVVECIVALYLAVWWDRISFMPSGIVGDAVEIFITVLWFVGMANAFNYVDGLDGLAAGLGLIAGVFFGSTLFLEPPQYVLGAFSFGLAASCGGFLPHNFRRRRKVFLGDSGSVLIGFLLAGIAVKGDWGTDAVIGISIPLLILGVPLFDMCFTTVMRIAEGKVRTVGEWLRYAGFDHFHHYLLHLGLSRSGTVLFIWTVGIVLGVSGLLVRNDTTWEGVMAMLQGGLIFMIIGILMVMGRKRRLDEG